MPRDRWFEKMVRKAVRQIPANLRDALENIEIVIEEYPDPEYLREIGLEGPLLGLYEGVPLPEKEQYDYPMPDKITIYRGSLLDLGLTEKDLIEEIRITVIHEIGHYFGLEDDHLEEHGY